MVMALTPSLLKGVKVKSYQYSFVTCVGGSSIYKELFCCIGRLYKDIGNFYRNIGDLEGFP